MRKPPESSLRLQLISVVVMLCGMPPRDAAHMAGMPLRDAARMAGLRMHVELQSGVLHD